MEEFDPEERKPVTERMFINVQGKSKLALVREMSKIVPLISGNETTREDVIESLKIMGIEPTEENIAFVLS